MKYFLDTNICIYFLKGISKNLQNKFSRINPNDIKIPTMVKAELLYGIEKSVKKKENTKLVNDFLLPFEVIPFDDSSTKSYSKIRFTLEKDGKMIDPNDLIIAATVLTNKGTLVTNNTKEFKRVKGLKVVNWV